MKTPGLISPRYRDRGNHGIALIAVLWLLALLTLLGTAMATLSISQRRAAERYLQAAQAETIADSAIRLALLKLFTPPEKGTQLRIGEPQTVELLGTAAQVVVWREATRVDLNVVDPELLFAVFAANGWNEDDARGMAARIVDWRDADDVSEEGGAEQGAYDAAGIAYGPRNGPFESIEELRQVIGSERIEPTLFDAFTVYTHTPLPAYAGAPSAVIRALIFANERQLGGRRWLSAAEEQRQSVLTESDTSLAGEVVRIRACLTLRDAQLCREAVVRVTGNTQRPVQIFSWQTLLAPVV